MRQNEREVVVVGAGIVGLCIAYEAIKTGAATTIVDRDPEGDKASYGNAGGIAVTEVVPASVPGLWKKVPFWMFDPLGPLAVRAAHTPKLLPWLWRFARSSTAAEVNLVSDALAQLNGRVYDDLVPLLNEVGLADDLYRKGALTVYETVDGLQRDRHEWDLKRRHGVEVHELSGSQVREMEPALGPVVRAGVFTPQWSHISDPKRIVDVLRGWLVANGAELISEQVKAVQENANGANLVLGSGAVVQAAKVVIAAGAWSAQLAKQLGDRVLLESERGYNTTIPSPGITLGREVIFADRKFVATPLSVGLRIGGAAEFGGLDALPNYKRSKALVELAKLYLPDVKAEGGVEWAGHRPTTPDSLPIIGRSTVSPNVLYAFGHGHLGLTQAPTTGKIIGDLLCGRNPPINLMPFSAARFDQKRKLHAP